MKSGLAEGSLEKDEDTTFLASGALIPPDTGLLEPKGQLTEG